MTPIRLEEYGSGIFEELTAEDLRFLAVKHQGAVTVWLDPLSGSPMVSASSWVGAITLPSGRELRITTKVPVASLFYMLAVGSQWPFFPEDLVGYDPDESILYVVARFFRDQLLQIDQAGLYRTYRDEAANLTTIRGRIDFREDLLRNLIERQHTACSYSEFTRDVPENQVLRQVTHLLADCGLVGDLETGFRTLDYWWSDIEVTHHNPGIVTTFMYHRLNEHYELVHQLAALLLSWLSPGGAEGDRRFPAFLVNMNSLYEEFIRQSVRIAVGDSVRVRKPGHLSLDVLGHSKIQPDLLFEERGAAFGVADCKYKVVSLDGGSNSDVYQVLAYCIGLGLTTGVLIYPRHLVDVGDELMICHSDVRVHRITFNLALPPPALKAECVRTGRALVDLYRSSSRGERVHS